MTVALPASGNNHQKNEEDKRSIHWLEDDTPGLDSEGKFCKFFRDGEMIKAAKGSLNFNGYLREEN